MGIITTGIVISTTRVVWVVAPLLMLSMMAFALRWRLLPRRGLLADFFNPNLAGIAVGLALVTAMSVVSCPLAPPTASAAGSQPAPASPYVSNSSPASGPPLAVINPFADPGCVRSGSVFMQHAHGFFAAGSTSSFTGRLKVAKLAFQGWLQRPVFGHGSGSFLYVFGPAAGGWIGNLELHMLFDTGIVGLLLLLVALVAAGRPAIRALGTAPTLSPASGGELSARGRSSGWETTHYVLFGLVAAGVALILTYQFTEGTWLGFTWVFFGMLVAAGRLTRGIAPRLRSA
jgi:hypothetical protein